jgi:hypothetical protein
MDRYVIQKRIGDGTYGEVILATNKQSGEKVRNPPLIRPPIAGSLVLALAAAAAGILEQRVGHQTAGEESTKYPG